MVFPLGLSDSEGMMNLNLNGAEACSSLMPSHPEAWWCAQTHGRIAVPVVRLDTILNMLPPEYEMYYLKVDVEGADMHVLRGAGKYLQQFKLVTTEVDNDPTQKTRLGSNSENQTVAFMEARGFKGKSCEYKECHFSREISESALTLSKDLHNLGHGVMPTKCDGVDIKML